MPQHRPVLPQNISGWDRSLRVALAAAIVLGLPAWVRNPYVLMAGGAAVGFQVLAASTGF